MSIGKRILQVLVLVAVWLAWDFYGLKEWFMNVVSGGAETPDLTHVFLAYMTPFVLGFVLSEMLVRTLRIDQLERSEEYG